MPLFAGIMSGTSLDGIDVAFAEIDLLNGSSERPHFDVRPAGDYYEPYPAGLRAELQPLREGKPVEIAVVSRLHYELGARYANALIAGAEKHRIDIASIRAIGMHGQTVWHAPPSANAAGAASTLQIGSAPVLAERARVRVVSDFRAADIAAGGEGAPLIPFADYVLLRSSDESRAILNIGGIANVTFLPVDGSLWDTRAFDTGPGNMVIDAVVSSLTVGKTAYDAGGAMAASGAPDERLLEELLAAPYFQKPPPKSTGAELFGRAYAQEFLARCKGLSPEDMVATATALTARSVAYSFERFLPAQPDRIILGGGGAHNTTLIRYLSSLLPDTAISYHAEFGLDGDSKEALAFALLAAAHIHGVPANIPAVTGASDPRVLGSLTPAPTASGL